MKQRYFKFGGVGLALTLTLALAGCNEGKADPKAEAPPPANVQADLDAKQFQGRPSRAISVGDGG